MYCKSTYFGVGVFLVFVTERFTISYFENYSGTVSSGGATSGGAAVDNVWGSRGGQTGAMGA